MPNTPVDVAGQLATFSPQRLKQPSLALERVVRRDEHIVLGQGFVVRNHVRIVYDYIVDVSSEQRRALEETIRWARTIRESLQPTLDARRVPVHFRPSSRGISVVGLLHERPQRGKGGIRDVDGLVRQFEAKFEAHCRKVDQGRPTKEKALQSFLIRESYKNSRRIRPINEASSRNDPIELVFVTDEIALPIDAGRIVCDILAVRRDGPRWTPVVLELKSARHLAKLVAQVEAYAALVDGHAELFAELFGVILGELIRFHGKTEKWIVWPQAGAHSDPREDELVAKGIRVVGYVEKDGSYAFRTGCGVRRTRTAHQ